MRQVLEADALMATLAPDPLAFLADIVDPPAWEPVDRMPLRPHQVAPAGDWELWLLEGGRGAGKTEAGSRHFCTRMRQNPGWRGLIIAPTFGDAVEACIEGPSGILSVDPGARFITRPGGSKVIWPNGSEALVLGTPTPREVERLRAAGNRHIFWWEEMAANPQLRRAWDIAFAGLREGARPEQIATTTPRPLPFFKELRKRPGTVTTHGTIFDNPKISQEVKDRLVRHYEGTRIGRQELYGELLEDVDGALWTSEMIEAAHVNCPRDLPEMERVVVAIDPAVTYGEDSDDTGIIVAGKGRDGFGYVLADRTCHLSPDGWARRAVAAYEEFMADRIVGEVNNGGDLVELTIRTVSQTVPFRAVHASRAKVARAEPVSALYEQGRVFHVGSTRELDDQLTTWTPDSDESPDRLDALVWAMAELGLAKVTKVRVVKGPRL